MSIFLLFQGMVATAGVEFSDAELEQLVHELDRDGDGKIHYNELARGQLEFTEREREMLESLQRLNVV